MTSQSTTTPTTIIIADSVIVEVFEAIITFTLKNNVASSGLDDSQKNVLTQVWKFGEIACNKAIKALSESKNLRGMLLKIGDKINNSIDGKSSLLEVINRKLVVSSSFCLWERAALQQEMMKSIKQQQQQPPADNPSELIRPCDFFSSRFYGSKMKTTLAEAHKLSPLCTTYTYQFVRRVLLTGGMKPATKKTVVNGEILKRVFICMPDVRSALAFVSMWLSAQKNAAPQEATCMLECGTHDETLRKWVMDVDASICELSEKDGFVKDPITGPTGEELENMQMAVLQMASAVSHSLFEMGALYKPCSFAVTSRHSNTKMSWHITLHALASHDVWRYFMFELDKTFGVKKAKKTPPEWAMFKYVDGSTKRNSKSQYMQILGSTKVKAGCEHDGRFFKKEGIFDCNGQPMEYPHLSDELFYAATSMVIHDPWSIPFKMSETPALLLLKEKKRKPAKIESDGADIASSSKLNTSKHHSKIHGSGECDDQRFGNLASWDRLPSEPKKWMKGFIDGSFSADLRYIPAMSKPQNWCDDVMRLVNTGRGKLLVYAYVDNPAVCPRFLKIKGAIHTHANKHCVLMCVEETHPSCSRKNYRMFVRCFSPKCNELKSPQHRAGWIEVIYDDYLKLLSLSSGLTTKSGEKTLE